MLRNNGFIQSNTAWIKVQYFKVTIRQPKSTEKCHAITMPSVNHEKYRLHEQKSYGLKYNEKYVWWCQLTVHGILKCPVGILTYVRTATLPGKVSWNWCCPDCLAALPSELIMEDASLIPWSMDAKYWLAEGCMGMWIPDWRFALTMDVRSVTGREIN